MEAVASTSTSFIDSSIPSNFSDELVLRNVAFCLGLPVEYINETLRTYPVWQIDKMFSICITTSYVQSVTIYFGLATGLPGNILALLTMLQFPRTTATFYLALLAVSDWMALFTKVVNISMHSFQMHATWSCKLVNTLSNFTSIYANWVLVLICFERLVTVLFPLKKGFYFTIKRAYISAAVLAFVIFLFCSVSLWTFVFQYGTCMSEDLDFGKKWNQVEITLYCYIPSLLMVGMVLIIWRAFSKVQKNRRIVFCGDDGSGANQSTEQRLRDQAKTERCITLMLLFASFIFILLTVPHCLMMVVMMTMDIPYPSILHLQLNLGYFATTGLVYLSHSVNFFVYFVSTKRFRSHLWKLLRCSRLMRGKSKQDRTEQTTVDLL